MRSCVCTCVRGCTLAHTCIRACTLPCLSVRAHPVCACLPACLPACMHACMHAYMCTRICLFMSCVCDYITTCLCCHRAVGCQTQPQLAPLHTSKRWCCSRALGRGATRVRAVAHARARAWHAAKLFVYVHMRVRTCAHTHVHVHVHVHARTHAHTNARARMPTYARSCTHACTDGRDAQA